MKPRLAGQRERYLANEMRAYRDKISALAHFQVQPVVAVRAARLHAPGPRG